jgi:hypothetical protein
METIIFIILSMATVVNQKTVQLDTNTVTRLMFGIISTTMTRELFRAAVMVTTSLVYIDQCVIWFIVLRSLCAAR